MHAVLYGVSREALMAKHKSNHIQCVYSLGPDAADKTLAAKAAMAEGLGMKVNVCGKKRLDAGW